MNVVKNILGRDNTDEEVRIMKEDLAYYKSKGMKAEAMRVQERLEGLI